MTAAPANREPIVSCKRPVEGAKGRRILFIDTCHSGNAYYARLGNAAYHTNIIACTAASCGEGGRQVGRWTCAVIESLEGASPRIG